ncbi:MAG: peptidase MA family metallohydrolase [Limisphaerales bacterium]
MPLHLPPASRPGGLLAGLAVLLLGAAARLPAAELDDLRELQRTGRYEAALEMLPPSDADKATPAELELLRGELLLTLGRYPEAHAAVGAAVAREPRNVRLRWLAYETARRTGDGIGAAAALDQIRLLVTTRPWAYRDASSLVVFGRTALRLGADPKQVLDEVYATATKLDADSRDVFLARGELAFDKGDFDLAARAFGDGLKKHPGDPDLRHGLARAYADGDREAMIESLEGVLETNPRHVPSLLLLTDHRLDAEDYDGAQKTLAEVRAVNPWHPDAWAYEAVIAHLRNETDAEAGARAKALKYWAANPEVDHLLGRKLSQKYRFAEGADRQRQALKFDPEFLPAKAQLATDLLRLGESEEGWRLAQEVHKADAYDVTAFNLVTLKDTMAGYATLTNEYFVVRLAGREAAVYGPRVLALLERARTNLVTRYGVELEYPTTVEIFAEEKDFGVRTFGMPDNPGYLGVCFGRVITANSPAANRGGRVNWEAVLWHEFAHVVTLQMTANKMPRWLSEGISVYEEGRENPSWGQRMTPRFRDMILRGDMPPIAGLSAAFLTPKTPFHLQFAYFQSSLAVQFLIEKHGLDALTAVLTDLKAGTPVNDALARRAAPLAELEKDFKAFAEARARGLGPGLDWEKPPESTPPAQVEATLAGWEQTRPTNYWVLQRQAERFTEEKNWAAAKAPLEKLVTLHPDQTGADSAWAQLAAVQRALGDTPAEQRTLEAYAARDAGATDAYLRLMELAAAAEDWPAVRRYAEQFLAVNPLVAPPHRLNAQAAEELGDGPAAIASWEAVLQLEPPDPAEVHFRLARLLHRSGHPEARRQVLLALEEAPRHRAALALLLDMQPAPAGETARP